MERNVKISQIAEMIKRTFNAGKEVNKEKLILVIMKDLLTTRRTAIEYINSARIFINFSEEAGILKQSKKAIQTNISA